jgi:A/G-specific adenine glycosylase
LCRVYDIAEDPRAPEVEAELWRLSTELVQAAPDGQAGDLNESLMELGALICTPGAPQCHLCPLNEICLAHERRTVHERPLRTTKPVTPHYDMTSAVVRDAAGRYLLIQRPLAGLLGGLWGFPGGMAQAGEPVEQTVVRAVREQTGVSVALQLRLATIKHAYTHYKITLHPFSAWHTGGSAMPVTCKSVRWVDQDELSTLPLAVTDRKVAAML